MPDVSDALATAGVSLSLCTTELFMAALCTTLPSGTALRVWDAMFLLGSEVLFRVVLVLLYQHKERLLSVLGSLTTSGVSVGGADGASGASPTVTGGGSTAAKDTVAATAARVLAVAQPYVAAAAAARMMEEGEPATPEEGARPSPFLQRGGTFRSPQAAFPALFGMIKSMPANAHDADALLRLAYPPDEGARAHPKALAWSRLLPPGHLAKLRAAARTAVTEEHAAFKAGKGAGGAFAAGF